MLDIPNKQHQTPKQGALEVLTTSRAYNCQGFPTPPSTNQNLKITLVPNKKNSSHNTYSLNYFL